MLWGMVTDMVFDPKKIGASRELKRFAAGFLRMAKKSSPGFYYSFGEPGVNLKAWSLCERPERVILDFFP